MLASLSACERPLPVWGALHAPRNPAPSPAPQSEACRTLAPERDKATKHCCIQLPDGTSCTVPVRAGLSIKEVLSGLCERHGISGAAVDLFLVGGDKVLGLEAPQGPFPGGPPSEALACGGRVNMPCLNLPGHPPSWPWCWAPCLSSLPEASRGPGLHVGGLLAVALVS